MKKLNLLLVKISIVITMLLALFNNAISQTEMVADINPTWDSRPDYLTVFNGKLYFEAYTTSGYNLLEYDGINNPIIVQQDQNFSQPWFLTVFNNKLYFEAQNNTFGQELWVYDGHNPPTMVDDIYPGTSGSNPTNFKVFNGKLYFSARDDWSGTELFVYDGINSPVMVANINPTVNSSNPKYLTVYNNKLFFQATTSTLGTELWQYDGTNPPVMVANINPGSNSSNPSYLTVFNNKLYFFASDGTVSGYWLWSYDGINPPTITDSSVYCYNIGPLVVFNNKLYWGSTSILCYNSDSIYSEFNVAPQGASNPQFLTIYNGRLYFKEGDDLWCFDGANHYKVDDHAGIIDATNYYFAVFQNSLYYQAKDNPYTACGYELYRYSDNADNNSPYQLKGHFFVDNNQNAQRDPQEQGLSFIRTWYPDEGLSGITNYNGEFVHRTLTGNHVVSFIPNENWTLTTDSMQYHVFISDSVPVIDNLNFGFYPDTAITDMTVSLAGGSRCNRDEIYWINFSNKGTSRPFGVVELVLDDSLTFISSEISPDSIIGKRVYWNFDSLFFFENRKIRFVVHTPDFNSIGDTLTSRLNVFANYNGDTFVFKDTLSRKVLCSYDPNDKLVTPEGAGVYGRISKYITLEYIIRFQNTGNDTAVNVKLCDMLDPNLNINSFKFIGSSHPNVDINIEQNRNVIFKLDSIMLPDSSVNEPASHGFVKYQISIDTTIAPNTRIYNYAKIYFDVNPPIKTNTVLNTIECSVYPNAPQIILSDTILVVNTEYQVQWYLNDSIISDATGCIYNPQTNGDYMVEVFDSIGCSSFSNIYIYINDISEIDKNLITKIYPNPTTGIVNFEFIDTNIDFIKIYDQSGKLIYQNLNIGKQEAIDISKFATGTYIISVCKGKDIRSISIIKR